VEIKDLGSTDIAVIVDCLVRSFADYFVPMSPDIEYWKARFRLSRIDLNLSVGYFEHGILTGFILTGIDKHQGLMTAYNGGTGVVPSSRGKGVVDKLYEYAIPHFKSTGIEKCLLEVITQNHRAIKVYERIGFQKTKTFRCFKGFLPENTNKHSLEIIAFEDINQPSMQEPQNLCWDHMAHAMQLAGDTFTCYKLTDAHFSPVGFFMLNRENGYVSQLDLLASREPAQWDSLIQSMGLVVSSVKINNIDARRHDLIEALERNRMENFINQYEMELYL
jgi:RimJ/RimL family protein N-acetyltransferase